MRSTKAPAIKAGRDDGELHLEGHEGQVRHAALVLPGQAREEHIVQAADEAADRGAEGQGVADDHPLDGDQGQGEVHEHERGEHVLLPDHAPVKEGQPGRHEQHEG
jgi:hypothetical protein